MKGILLRSACTAIILYLLSGVVLAELEIYSVDGKFEAAFPSNPEFNGETGKGKERFRSYSYTDENNLVVYTAIYQVDESRFKKGDVPKALRNFVEGQALIVGGHVKSYSANNRVGPNSAVFHVKYEYQGMPVRKYGVVAYRGNRFYQWTVQDFPSMSRIDGRDIFETYVGRFAVN